MQSHLIYALLFCKEIPIYADHMAGRAGRGDRECSEAGIILPSNRDLAPSAQSQSVRVRSKMAAAH